MPNLNARKIVRALENDYDYNPTLPATHIDNLHAENSDELRAVHVSVLNDLDLIASMILAMAWSGGNSQGKEIQKQRDRRTVAVISVNQVLYVAGNAISFEPYRLQMSKGNAKDTPNAQYFLPKRRGAVETSPAYKTNDVVFSGEEAIREVLLANGERRRVQFVGKLPFDLPFAHFYMIN